MQEEEISNKAIFDEQTGGATIAQPSQVANSLRGLRIRTRVVLRALGVPTKFIKAGNAGIIIHEDNQHIVCVQWDDGVVTMHWRQELERVCRLSGSRAALARLLLSRHALPRA